MLFKKENKPTYVPGETIIKERIKELGSCKNKLMGKVINAYTINASLCCYIPNSPDYNEAVKVLQEEQIEIRNIIANYDNLRHEVIQLENKFGLHYAIPATSHTIIEIAIRNFISK